MFEICIGSKYSFSVLEGFLFSFGEMFCFEVFVFRFYYLGSIVFRLFGLGRGYDFVRKFGFLRFISFFVSVRNYRYSIYLIILNYCWDFL